MIGVAASSLVALWLRSMGSFDYAVMVACRSKLVWTLGLAGGIWFGRALRPANLGGLRRSAIRIAAGVALAVTAYLAWSDYRCMNLDDQALDRGWPYPDGWILAMERRAAARRPIIPGVLAMCGYFAEVGDFLGRMTLGAANMAGLVVRLGMGRRQSGDASP